MNPVLVGEKVSLALAAAATGIAFVVDAIPGLKEIALSPAQTVVNFSFLCVLAFGLIRFERALREMNRRLSVLSAVVVSLQFHLHLSEVSGSLSPGEDRDRVESKNYLLVEQKLNEVLDLLKQDARVRSAP